MAELNTAKFGDNILIIDKGVYGEDIRTAIKENIEINNQLIGDLNANIDSLQSRVDALSGGGGDDDGGGGGGGNIPSGSSIAYSVARVVGGSVTPFIFADDATPI